MERDKAVFDEVFQTSRHQMLAAIKTKTNPTTLERCVDSCSK
jgi:hypothetical protein